MTRDVVLDIDVLYYLFSKNDRAEPSKIKLLSKSFEYSTYYIKANNYRYVAKIYEKTTTLSKVAFLLEALSTLSSSNLNFSRIEFADFVGDSVVIVFEYIDGKICASWDQEQSFSVGLALSRLHIKTSNFIPTTSFQTFFEQITSMYEKVVLYLPDNFKHIHLEFLYFENKNFFLPRGIIHGDPYNNNIVFTKNGSAIFLENTFLNYDYFLFDICHVFKKYYFDRKQVQPLKTFKSFIRGYETNRVITVAEKQAMPDIIRARLLYSLLYLFHSSLLISKTPHLFIDICYANYLKLMQARSIKKIDI